MSTDPTPQYHASTTAPPAQAVSPSPHLDESTEPSHVSVFNSEPQNTAVIQGKDAQYGSAPAQTLPADLILSEEVSRENATPVSSPPIQEKPMNMIVEEGAPQMVTPLERLTDQPTHIDCPHCHHRTMTAVTKEGNSMQAISAALCCLCCGVITVCIPCLCHWFEDTHIFCSRCKKKVATIPDDGPIQVFGPAPPQAIPSIHPRV